MVADEETCGDLATADKGKSGQIVGDSRGKSSRHALARRTLVAHFQKDCDRQ